jgi:hypothetical protein
MKCRSKKVFLLAFNLVLIIPSEAQEQRRFQLLDSQFETPIIYAYVRIPSKKLVELTDKDGFFTLPKLENDSVFISHIAYKQKSTTYNLIKKKPFVYLEELPLKTNPIIISAKDTKKIVDNAIGKNYYSISPPQYLKCFRRDRILFRDTIAVEAFAEITVKVIHLFPPSQSGIILSYLNNIIVNTNPVFITKNLPPFDLPANYAPVNAFIVEPTKEQEKTVYYTKLEARDSLIIIAVKPRLDFKPNKEILVQNGEIAINKRTGKIIRIDTNLGPEMMEISRDENYRKKGINRYMYHYSLSMIFDQAGLVKKFSYDFRFSLFKNSPNDLWEIKSDFIISKLSAKPDFANTIGLLRKDSILVKMVSNCRPDFFDEVSKVFTINNSYFDN